MIKLNFFKSVLFLLVLGISVSCKKGSDPAPSSNNSNNGGNTGGSNSGVTFLKVGTTHTYLYTGFFGGTVITKVEQEVGKDTFMVRNTSEEVTTIYPTVYYVLKDGNLSSSFRLRDPNTYFIRCKFNVPVGTSWSGTENGSAFTCTIDSLNASVNTGKGLVKDAIKVKIVIGGRTTYNYYSPTLGLLGTGSFGSDAEAQLEDYTISNLAPSGAAYPITFGDYAFMKVGNKWRYSESIFGGDEDFVNISIESKLPNANIYKVKVAYESDASKTAYQYWYEDNGLLMVYEDGESLLSADPIYMNESIAKVGYGWAGRTGLNTLFIYKITDLDSPQTTYWGELPSMGIAVSNGLFAAQTNYWNKDKGNVLVSGLLSRDVVSTNVRKGSDNRIIIPGINF
jgi:hypothetical protein